MNEEIMTEILKAAKEEFLSLGYIDASMRNIAKKANLTTGSLYYHFVDKAEMLDAVVGNEAEELCPFGQETVRGVHGIKNRSLPSTMRASISVFW